MKFFKNSGLKQYLAFALIFAALAGGYFVYKSHAQTPPTLVTAFNETPRHLALSGGSYLKKVNGQLIAVARDNTKSSSAAIRWSNSSITNEIYRKYIGYKIQVCADVKYPSKSGNLFIVNYVFPSRNLEWKDISASTKDSVECTPYATLKSKNTKTNPPYAQPDVQSLNANAYIYWVQINIAK